MKVQCANVFQFLYAPKRYKVSYGGRGGAKSWQYADALLIRAQKQWERILCTREFQSSIADSVHRLLKDRILHHGWLDRFDVTDKKIVCRLTGAEFIFKGLHHNIMEIKSTEGVTICWVEEAQSVSKDSWDILIPTIRASRSEIWVSFNTGEEDDPTYQRFVVNPPPDSVVKKVGWQDNPWFPPELEAERAYCQKVDPEAYENIWEGMPKRVSEACIFKNKYRVAAFDTPENARFYFGADFGFSQDPSTLMRMWIDGRRLMIDHEAWGVGVELDEMEAFYDAVPESRNWTIRADNSRPETISFIKKKDSKLSVLRSLGSAMSQMPKQTNSGPSEKVSLISDSLRRLLSMSDASTWPTKQSSTPTRSTNRPERFSPSSLMPGIIVGMPSDMPCSLLSARAPIGRA